jgi:hypothetical protein
VFGKFGTISKKVWIGEFVKFVNKTILEFDYNAKLANNILSRKLQYIQSTRNVLSKARFSAFFNSGPGKESERIIAKLQGVRAVEYDRVPFIKHMIEITILEFYLEGALYNLVKQRTQEGFYDDSGKQKISEIESSNQSISEKIDALSNMLRTRTQNKKPLEAKAPRTVLLSVLPQTVPLPRHTYLNISAQGTKKPAPQKPAPHRELRNLDQGSIIGNIQSRTLRPRQRTSAMNR